ncbi:AP2 domain-containing protein [Deinococcus sp. Leaf326]|uniref:AP2 domain-containing protein n=1 Tax=Deinococcus sp. Leaf326 TaxID=1736338 RepID=UPI0007018252|nr:AP2 domain-containing protein [Deinococcus sp. Leaf326]KQR22910.1 hypothetical protein ASF71_07010 [Deinococcus sp. Leaf326]
MKRGVNEYRVVGEVAYLALTNRAGETVAETMIDVADLPLVLADPRRWSRLQQSHTCYVHRTISEKSKTEYLHRVLFPDAENVDHINGDGLDNRRSNLRPCTFAENQRNCKRYRNNQSGYKGVRLVRQQNKWEARICKDKKLRSLGLFPTVEDAAHAYDRAARVLHGEFARLNFPDDAQPALLRRPA